MLSNRLHASHWIVLLLWFGCAGDAPPDEDGQESTSESPLTLSTQTVALMPSADSFVESGTAAAQTFGASTSIRVDRDSYDKVEQGLLRFDVPANVGTINRATLRVYVTNGSTNSASFFQTAGGWAESTTTWNTRPATTGSPVATLGVTTTATWAQVDVTSVVRAGATLSLAVIPGSEDGFWFSSKEATTNQPQLLLELAAPPQPPPPPPGATVVVSPYADTYVRSLYPDNNYASATTVIADLAESGAGDVEQGYIGFHIGNVGNIAMAKLRLNVVEGTTNGPTLWTMSSTTWRETMTWNTRAPADGVPVARIGSASAGTWIEVDVTNAVASNQTVSFAIVANSTDGFDFSSRESTNKPQLVLTTAAAPVMNNPNCTLVVPDYPLTAQGLATPYQLKATDPAAGPCSEANADQQAFVEATIIDPTTGAVSVFHPLVINAGAVPTLPPVVPTLPAGAVVGLWFGYNGGGLTLSGTSSTSLDQGKCVNGLGTSIMGQFAHCNGVAFFAVANQAIAAGRLHPPALATAKDGQPCPTSRSFAVVDQDQSDNVVTTYLMTSTGGLAQNTAANRTKLGTTAAVVRNGSDERLTTVLGTALGCTPWMAPDLDDPGATAPSLALNELMAAKDQTAPVATVPVLDPMTLVDGIPNLTKLNLYRAGVDQPAFASLSDAWQSQLDYCNQLLTIGPARIALDQPLTSVAASPDPGAANSLFTFLAQRFNFAWGPNGLNCAAITYKTTPIVTTEDANGVTVSATIAR